jgi:hypothetical protein
LAWRCGQDGVAVRVPGGGGREQDAVATNVATKIEEKIW